MTDVDIFINILKEKFPNYYFRVVFGYNVLEVFGVKDDEIYSFCHNLSECMCKPVNRIVFIEPLVNKLGYA
jgi:hypothetical protein